MTSSYPRVQWSGYMCHEESTILRRSGVTERSRLISIHFNLVYKAFIGFAGRFQVAELSCTAKVEDIFTTFIRYLHY